MLFSSERDGLYVVGAERKNYLQYFCILKINLTPIDCFLDKFLTAQLVQIPQSCSFCFSYVYQGEEN